jgi:hypothetical protein
MRSARSQMRTHLALFASAVLLTGCWPARFVERPEVRGTVLSAQTHEPVAGARVAVASLPRPERMYVVTTDSNGRFEIPADRHWGLYSPLGEGWPVSGFVEVSAEGFASERQPLRWSQTGQSRNDVGVISLAPVP